MEHLTDSEVEALQIISCKPNAAMTARVSLAERRVNDYPEACPVGISGN